MIEHIISPTNLTNNTAMPYLSIVIVSLYLFWLILSGYWDNPLLLSLGAASTALAAYIAWQIEKRYPFLFIARIVIRLPAYWVWLTIEVVKSNIDVLKCIWMPKRHPLTPSICVLPMSQRSRLGRTAYANSITLTPGTVAIDVMGTEVLVHALTEEGIHALQEGTMDRRVTAMEGKAE